MQEAMVHDPDATGAMNQRLRTVRDVRALMNSAEYRRFGSKLAAAADIYIRGLATFLLLRDAAGFTLGSLHRAVQASMAKRDVGVVGRPHILPSASRAELQKDLLNRLLRHKRISVQVIEREVRRGPPCVCWRLVSASPHY